MTRTQFVFRVIRIEFLNMPLRVVSNRLVAIRICLDFLTASVFPRAIVTGEETADVVEEAGWGTSGGEEGENRR